MGYCLGVYPSDSGFTSGQSRAATARWAPLELRATHVDTCLSTLLYSLEERDCVFSVSVSHLLTISHLSHYGIDAGGARAISQLRILAKLMNKINPESPNDEPKRPCDVFNMIGGTGTGG